MKIFLTVALPALASAAALAEPHELLKAALAHSHEHIASVPMFEYKDDCGKKSNFRVKPGAAAMLQVDNVPGAGVAPFKPFETVLKDGFLPTDCVKDYMYYRGDKFGNNKFDYKLAPVSNVSIVHYADVVAKEDQQEMTQKVCFEFCRTVPNMGFFGIVNGRNCYCTPYFTPMASDSSQCDAVCEGEKTLMCGGNSKSSIFTMHMCASTKEDLNQRSQTAFTLSSHIASLTKVASGLSASLQDQGEIVQSMAGQVGDSGASNLAQGAKVWAGSLEHSAEDASKIGGQLSTLAGQQDKLGKDFTDPAVVTEAEHIMDEIDETVAHGEAAADVLEGQIAATSLADEQVHQGAAGEYYPAMYFVDKEYSDVPSTCTGDLVGQPMVGTMDACASACDNHVHSCVGFQYFASGEDSFCHLLSGFTSGFYYTDCKPQEKMPEKMPPKKGPPGFLQANKKGDFAAGCWAKLSKFEGTTLKPDGSGKCKQCFKELTKADRCPW